MAGRKRSETLQCGLAIGVDAEMFSVAGESGAVAVEWNGGAREVERAPIERSHNLYGVGIVEFFGWARHGQRSYIHIGPGKEPEQGREEVGGKSGLVSLDIDVDLRV